MDLLLVTKHLIDPRELTPQTSIPQCQFEESIWSQSSSVPEHEIVILLERCELNCDEVPPQYLETTQQLVDLMKTGWSKEYWYEQFTGRLQQLQKTGLIDPGLITVDRRIKDRVIVECRLNNGIRSTICFKESGIRWATNCGILVYYDDSDSRSSS